MSPPWLTARLLSSWLSAPDELRGDHADARAAQAHAAAAPVSLIAVLGQVLHSACMVHGPSAVMDGH